jgi:cytochrome P450
MMENWSQLMEPGNTPPVDIFPFLHWIPESWLGSWVSRSKNVGAEMNGLYSGMLELVKNRRKEGTNKGSFMDVVLDQNEKLGLSNHELYFLGGTMMEGGSDTTSSIVIAFVHAMTKWGDVLRKAQAEIDSVMGEERTPVWEDYEKLPYVAQTVKEAMRWRPVVPLAFPHALTEGETHCPFLCFLFLALALPCTSLPACSCSQRRFCSFRPLSHLPSFPPHRTSPALISH